MRVLARFEPFFRGSVEEGNALRARRDASMHALKARAGTPEEQTVRASMDAPSLPPTKADGCADKRARPWRIVAGDGDGRTKGRTSKIGTRVPAMGFGQRASSVESWRSNG